MAATRLVWLEMDERIQRLHDVDAGGEFTGGAPSLLFFSLSSVSNDIHIYIYTIYIYTHNI